MIGGGDGTRTHTTLVCQRLGTGQHHACYSNPHTFTFVTRAPLWALFTTLLTNAEQGNATTLLCLPCLHYQRPYYGNQFRFTGAFVLSATPPILTSFSS